RAVLSVMPERKAAWEEQVRELLAHASEQGEDWQPQVELCTALLALLAGKEANLPDEHLYRTTIEAVKQEEDPSEPASSPAIADGLLQAIQEFMNVEDWLAARHVVEVCQEQLLRPEIELIFLQLFAQARQAGEEQLAEHLERYLAVLLACQ